jgi:hypothetical protein
MIAEGGRTIAAAYLKRPRFARPFTTDDVQRLDQLRPWLAHAFRRAEHAGARAASCDRPGTAGTL